MTQQKDHDPDVQARLRAHLDGQMPSARELSRDFARVLERRRHRRRVAWMVAAPAALATAAVLVFVFVRAPASDEIFISIARSGQPASSALVVDVRVPHGD
jgi:hypothetical protein